MFIFDCMYYYQLNLDCCWDIYTKSKFVLWQLFISDKLIPLQKVQFTYESIIRNSNVLFNTRALNPRLIYIYFFLSLHSNYSVGISSLSLVFICQLDCLFLLLLLFSLCAYFILFTWCGCQCCRSMHHKKHETRHQSVSSPSSLHHYRLATRSSTLKLNKSIKVKRLIKTSKSKNGTSFSLINNLLCSYIRTFLLEQTDNYLHYYFYFYSTIICLIISM
jgi:hypothetical protein